MFKNLVGNEHVKQTLRHLIAKGRVPNSMLLAGDEGIGKRQFAIELCRSLICMDLTEGEACGECPACRRAGTFTLPKPEDKDAHKRVIFSDHPDVGMVIAYNRTIPVDAIRHLESEANFRPYEAQSRFFIIDNADKMNDAAANALLKTLEEPPAGSHIFLVTSRADSMLPTIRSRCQVLRFAPVGTDEIEKYLIADRAFTHDEAKLAARLSRGSIGRAVSINIEKFRQRRDRMLAVVTNALETSDRAALLRISEEMNDAKNKDTFEESIDVLASLLHDVWTLRVSSDDSRVVNSDLSDLLGTLARHSASDNIPFWLADIDTMRENFAVNINRKVAADALFIGMTA
ncbi:MAG: DNA polymerase III subunit delta' [Pyrinomonadaceae bacterium]